MKSNLSVEDAKKASLEFLEVAPYLIGITTKERRIANKLDAGEFAILLKAFTRIKKQESNKKIKAIGQKGGRNKRKVTMQIESAIKSRYEDLKLKQPGRTKGFYREKLSKEFKLSVSTIKPITQ
jgi:ribosome-binding protein aMBF1 (putative translation factor)